MEAEPSGEKPGGFTLPMGKMVKNFRPNFAVSSAFVAVPLSTADRKVLTRRELLLGRMMQWSYLCLALGIVLFTVKDFLVYGGFEAEAFQEYIYFGMLVGAALGCVHALLAWHERGRRSAVRADLSAGFKIKKLGTLIKVEESGENEPVRLQFCEAVSGESEEFALRTIGDLIRIKPNPLVGKRIEIEYAPNSRMVLQLRESP